MAAEATDQQAEYYGYGYWFSHQRELGQPSIDARARSDLPERCTHWLSALLRYKLPPARVLELGSAHGAFVALLRWAGFDAMGLELSQCVAQFATATFNVPMLVGPVEDQKIEPGSLDAVALMDVMEHLTDPVRTMSHCLNLLQPDGILIIQTPCVPEGLSYHDLVEQSHPFLKMLLEEEHVYLFGQLSVGDFFRRLSADYISFEEAVFPQYDMFLVVSGAPLPEHPAEATRMALAAAPDGRMVQALLDLRQEARVQEEHCEALASDRLVKESVIGRLVEELDGIRADRSAKDDVISRLTSELQQIRADQLAKESVIGRLVEELDGIRADRSAKEQAVAQLRSLLQGKDRVIAQLGIELREYRSLGYGLAHVLGTRRLSRRTGVEPAELPHIRSTPEFPEGSAERSGSALHVGIDVMQVQFGLSGGVETYMATLVRALTREARQQVRLTLLCTPDQLSHLTSMFGDQVEYHTLGVEPVVALVAVLRSALRRLPPSPRAEYVNATFGDLRDCLGIDILHSPAQIFSRMDFNVPGVLHLHDLQHVHHPENFTVGDLEARNRLFSQSAALASAVVAASNSVRDDIIQHMGIPPSKVHTIPAACDPDVEEGLRTFAPDEARRTYSLPETFGLYPAQSWVHKNHARLIEALAIVRTRSPEHDLKLVFTGYRGFAGWPLAQCALEDHNMRDHVLTPDFVPTQHLAAIYRLATFCIVPSLFEASSYPVIEAQMLGCPAMCSNIPSLSELVSGGAGLVFDPLSPQDIADKMVQWLNDPNDRLEHGRRGQRRARRCHSLPTYAANILDVYRKVLGLHSVD